MSMRGLKAVLTAGGIGTRLLPFSKEIPKEMSPLITRGSGGSVQVKPMIQAIYEQLYDERVRDFLVAVGCLSLSSGPGPAAKRPRIIGRH